MGWFDFTTGITASHPADADDITWTLEEVITSTTLTADHFLVIVDASSGAIILTLPAAADHTNRIYTIKKIDSSGHTVTIDANGNETIDGEETVVLNLQYAYVTIVCDGDEWFIIGGQNVKMEDILERNFSLQLKELEKIEKNTNNIVSQLEKASDEEREGED